MESSVTFPQSTESANMNMSNVGQKPELGIPNPCAVKITSSWVQQFQLRVPICEDNAF